MDEQKALTWISDVFAVNGRTLEINDTRMSVAEWDSMGVLLLLARLEEDHGIVISADEVARFNTVRELYELLKKHQAFTS